MPESYLTYAAFALVCLVLLTLPFVPAFVEWRRPTDLAALPVSANYTSDIDHFARRLHADVSARLGEGPSTGYEDFELLPDAPDAADWQGSGKRLIARGSIADKEAILSKRPVYVQMLTELAPVAFPAGPPALPEWWQSEAVASANA